MRVTRIIRMACVLTAFLCSVVASAQTNGDKLFLEGQKLQKKMTVAAQTSAIKKFKAAKVVYTTASKKTMCDNQIEICNKNLASLKTPTPYVRTSGDKLFLEGQKLQQKMTVVAQTSAIKKFEAAKAVYTTANKKTMCDDQIEICNKNLISLKKPKDPIVELSLSETKLDFKSNPKEGTVQTVNITCNSDDIKISSKPDWVTVDIASKKLFVSVQNNDTEDERTGVVRVKCYDKEADLEVNQSKPSVFKSLGKLFKKKK